MSDPTPSTRPVATELDSSAKPRSAVGVYEQPEKRNYLPIIIGAVVLIVALAAFLIFVVF